jgi:hypothetical protein
MLRSILIVSSDQTLLDTRVLVLKSTGFTVMSATGIDVALNLARSVHPHLVIVCHTLSELEQSLFSSALLQACPDAFILHLREGEVNPCRLVADCELFFARKDPAKRMRANPSDGYPSNPDTGQSTNASIVQ